MMRTKQGQQARNQQTGTVRSRRQGSVLPHKQEVIVAKVRMRPQGTKTAGEREFETGKDEAWFAKIMELHSTWLANIKRTYDEYQQESLETIKHNRLHFDKLVSDAQQNDNDRQKSGNLALANAVTTADLCGKQGVAHRDIAINKTWNLEPSEGAAETTVLRSVTIDDASLKAIGAAVSIALTEAIASMGAKK